MKMAEPPSEAVAEEPNQEDLMMEKTQDVSVAEITETTNMDDAETEIPTAVENQDPKENVTIDGENTTENQETNLSPNLNENDKPANNNGLSDNMGQNNVEDSAAQNIVNSEETPVTVERSEELTGVNNIDEDKKEAVEEIIETTIVPVDSAVNNEVKNSEGSELVDQSANKQNDNLDDNTNEDPSRLTKNQLREHYENLQTKYSASELQLESLREQNAELITRINTLEEQLQKAGSKSSSVIDVQEKACQRDGLKVQADYLAHELSQVQDTEKYLREKVAELLEAKEESERKVKDLQLRLKRFVKDDEAKDERVAKLEMELREVSQEVQQLESYLDEETLQKVRRSRSNTENSTGQNGEPARAEGTTNTAMETPPPQSKACVIL